MLSVRKNLTEILLEVTNEQINEIANETLSKMRSKGQNNHFTVELCIFSPDTIFSPQFCILREVEKLNFAIRNQCFNHKYYIFLSFFMEFRN